MGNKGDNNRQRIVDAADQLFYMRGYNQTSFRDISMTTGIPRGNFYYYFKTKDDILNAVVDARARLYSEKLAQCEAASEHPAGRLLAFADMLESFEDNLIEVGCPIGTLTSELAKDEPHLQAKSREVFELMRNWLEQNYRKIGVEHPKEAAMDLLAQLQGITVMACAFRDKAYLHRGLENVRAQLKKLSN